MKLSIWIIKDWFGDKISETHVKNGKMTLESIRLYTKGIKQNRETLYVGISYQFFGGEDSRIVCCNQEDYLILDTDDIIYAVNFIQDAFGYYSAWDKQCKNIIEENRSLDDLLKLSVELFPSPIIVVDSAQKIVTVSNENAEFMKNNEWKEAKNRGSINDSLLKDFNLAHPDVYNYKHVFAVDSKYFFVKGYCKHLFIDGSRIASAILKVTGDDYSTGKLQLYDHYTEHIRLWIMSCKTSGSSFQVRSYFNKAIEGDEASINDMIRQTTLFGWDEKCKKVLFVIMPTKENNMFDMHMITNLTHEAAGSYAMIYQNKIIILINSDILAHSEFNNTLNNFLTTNSCCCAVSFSFSDMKLLNQAYELAISALEHNPVVPGILYHCTDTSLRRISKILREQASTTLIHPAVTLLKDYDEKNKTDYYRTLFCYLKNERRNQDTAEELFIHRNTLFQRLHKIEDIWPINLDDAEDRFLLLFSFYFESFSNE